MTCLRTNYKGKQKTKGGLIALCCPCYTTMASSSLSNTNYNNIEENDEGKPPPPPGEIPLKWPSNGAVSLEWVELLGATFDWSSKHVAPSELPSVLPVNVIDSLIVAASKILHREPNCLQIDVPEKDCSVVVVGDVHGQLHDVLFLLRDAGPPSDGRLFVFNGDYVDRGAWGLETYLLLLAWKVFLPHRVFLLRGNHESKFCTSVYGFEQEVMAKYGDQGRHIYRKCLGCFEGLPLASIIAGCVYTAHGGLFRTGELPSLKRSKGKKGRKFVSGADSKVLKLGSLDELAKARRVVLDPPWEGSNLIPGDVLWSDPSTHPGLSPNTERGIGLLWGPDCTEQFLDKNHLKASTERYNNRGAYIVLEPPDFATPTFHTFEAVMPRPKVNAYYDYENAIDSDEELDLGSISA
ncbi:serine/threonine-protein phosphatase 7 isoform X2 [Cryptomeria japonica]|uniref:serine/threonine-protein phosphatase 7 isoform X2 n=1 Tax=Cryptomeria japonica TaxID=3369 RepID=UPI0025AC892D|nr:serine/threonine-protein phosphatase 7 isoform X2 [Cryptomeria japonica]